MRRKLVKFVKRLAALLFVGAVVIALVLWIDHKTQTSLPPLTGRFPVGRASFDWIDESRTDLLARQQGAKRELTVWMWYPAEVGKSSTPSEYLPTALRLALARHNGPLFSSVLSRDTSRVLCHSFDNADVAADQPAYPVILMKPGFGALALQYTTLAEDLASHGYIVVASDSPYNTAIVVYQDGRIAEKRRDSNPSAALVQTWAADNRFLLDRLTALNKNDPSGRFQGRFDLQKIGVFGHSFGGAAAAEFCREDRRCTAGIDVDGAPNGPVIESGISRPFMFLVADHTGPLGAEDRQIMANIRNIYDRLPSGRLFATVRGANHFNFSDQSLLLNGILMRVSGATGKIGSQRGLTVAAAGISTFFDVHLKGAAPSSLEQLSSQYPEISLGFDNY